MKSYYFHLLRILWIAVAFLGTQSIPTPTSNRPHSKILEQLNSLDQHVHSSRAYRGDTWKNSNREKLRSTESLWSLPQISDVSSPTIYDEEGLLMKYLIFRLFRLTELSVKTLSSVIRVLGDTFAGVLSGIMKGVGSSLNLLASGVSHFAIHISPVEPPSFIDTEAVMEDVRDQSRMIALTTKWYHFVSFRRNISKMCLQLGKIMYGSGQVLIWIGEITEDMLLGLGQALQASFGSVEMMIRTSHKLVAYTLIILSRNKRENPQLIHRRNYIESLGRPHDLLFNDEKEDIRRRASTLHIQSPLLTVYDFMKESFAKSKNKTVSFSIPLVNTKNMTSLEKRLNDTMKVLWKHLFSQSIFAETTFNSTDSSALNESLTTTAFLTNNNSQSSQFADATMKQNQTKSESNYFANFFWLVSYNSTRKQQQLNLETVIHCIRMTERYTTFLYDVIYDSFKYDGDENATNSKKFPLRKILPNFDESIYEIPSIGWSLGIIFFLLWCIFMLFPEGLHHGEHFLSYRRSVWIGVFLLIGWYVLIQIEYIQRYRLLTRYRLNQFNQDINSHISSNYVIHHSTEKAHFNFSSDNLLPHDIKNVQSEQDLRFIPMKLPKSLSSNHAKCPNPLDANQEIEERTKIEIVGNTTFYHFEPPTKDQVDDSKPDKLQRKDRNIANDSFDTRETADKMLWLNIIFQSLWTMLDVEVLETTTILYPFHPSSVPANTPIQHASNLFGAQSNSTSQDTHHQSTKLLNSSDSFDIDVNAGTQKNTHESTAELHLGSSSGIGLGNYMNEMYAEMLQSQLSDISPPGITQVRLRTFDFGSSPPYFLDITSHILRNDTCVTHLMEHVDSKYRFYHGSPSSHSNQQDFRKLKMNEIYDLMKRFWKEHYVYLHPLNHQEPYSTGSTGQETFGSTRKNKAKTGKGHWTKTNRFDASKYIDADESLRDTFENFVYAIFQPSSSSDIGSSQAAPPPPFAPPRSAGSFGTTPSTEHKEDSNVKQPNNSWQTLLKSVQSLFQQYKANDTTTAAENSTSSSNVNSTRPETPNRNQRDNKRHENGTSTTYPLSSYPIYHTNQFILPCDILYIEMPFVFTSKDMKIIFSLRNEDLQYSMVPELSVTLGGLHIQGRLLLTIQLTPDYPFFGNATMRLSELPELDFQISSFQGGLDLTSIPVLYRFVNSTFYSLLTQYTDPMYTTLDMRHNICPSCDQPPSPSFHVSLLSTTSSIGQAVRRKILKWYRGVQEVIRFNPTQIWNKWRDQFSIKINGMKKFWDEKFRSLASLNSKIESYSNRSTVENDNSTIKSEIHSNDSYFTKHSNEASPQEVREQSVPWWKKAWLYLQRRGKS